jgi:hypothetical protein
MNGTRLAGTLRSRRLRTVQRNRLANARGKLAWGLLAFVIGFGPARADAQVGLRPSGKSESVTRLLASCRSSPSLTADVRVKGFFILHETPGFGSKQGALFASNEIPQDAIYEGDLARFGGIAAGVSNAVYARKGVPRSLTWWAVHGILECVRGGGLLLDSWRRAQPPKPAAITSIATAFTPAGIRPFCSRHRSRFRVRVTGYFRDATAYSPKGFLYQLLGSTKAGTGPRVQIVPSGRAKGVADFPPAGRKATIRGLLNCSLNDHQVESYSWIFSSP